MGETTDLSNKVLDLVDAINHEQLIRLCDISLVIEKDILDCYGDTLSITLVNIYKGEELLGCIDLPADVKIEMMQTPAGHIKVGDVIGYDHSNKRIRFGTVTKMTKDGSIYLTHSYSVVYGDDGKQAIYQSMDGSIEQYRVCQVL